MKKYFFLGCALAIIAFDTASSQIINGSTAAVVQRPQTSSSGGLATTSSTTNSITRQPSSSSDGVLLSRDEMEALIKAEPPAVAMTPEEKFAIDTTAKKNMRTSIQKQSIGERKDFLDVMTSSEKVIARRKALSEGQTIDDASLAEDEITSSDVDPSSDSEMEDYLFDKTGFDAVNYWQPQPESLPDAR